MGYHSITPFGRTTETVRTAVENHAPRGPAPCPIDKWRILRDLTAGRARFGLSDRDITVLQALLSCHPETRLDASGPLIVHPSNETICARANGMPCSTMRRHLARLVAEGFLLRRDSPNGKRFARRIAGSKIAFGFDLSPLVHRAAEISDAAESCAREAAELAALRQTVSLLRRDLCALIDIARLDHPADADLADLAERSHDIGRALRRKLDRDTLGRLELALREALDQITGLLDTPSAVSSSSDARNEQHQQISNKDSLDLEPEELPVAPEMNASSHEAGERKANTKNTSPSPLPLRLVLQACPEISVYAPDPIIDWRGFTRTAEQVRPMTGISSAVWQEAKTVLGGEQAAAVLGAMLQRFAEIRNPAGYLRSLVKKARSGGFSPARMVMALLPSTA